MSWIRPSGYSPIYNDIEGLLTRLTEPILAPIRRLLPMSWGIDLSPWLAIMLIGFVERLLMSVLG